MYFNLYPNFSWSWAWYRNNDGKYEMVHQSQMKYVHDVHPSFFYMNSLNRTLWS
jgi:hypothetical protein